MRHAGRCGWGGRRLGAVRSGRLRRRADRGGVCRFVGAGDQDARDADVGGDAPRRVACDRDRDAVASGKGRNHHEAEGTRDRQSDRRRLGEQCVGAVELTVGHADALIDHPNPIAAVDLAVPEYLDLTVRR